ncbi:MAG: Crp/Fnr family transcriptional regulator [Aquabacterium sp.]|nr:Crp/Fnr family transcriptional regulator [Aquabacterium sp.]
MEHPDAVAVGRTGLTERRPDHVARAAAPQPVRGPALPPGMAEALLWGSLLGTPALAADELATLAQLACLRQVAAGQSVISRSSAARNLVALRSGEVALGLRTSDGVFRTERIVHGPAWLDLSSAWLAGLHVMDGQAMGPASVVELPCDALQAQLAAHPGLAQRLIQGLAREVQALAANTHELMHKDAPGRLAQWLHARSVPLPGKVGQAMVQLADRKRDVASQLAITPETLSRLMRSFSRQGLIEVAGYHVRVIDPDGLARLAQA